MKCFVEFEAALIIELADERFRAVGIEHQLVAGLKLYGSLAEFGLLENAQQRAPCFQRLRRLSRPDLAKVDWMNSTGLGILISGLTTLRNNGGELKLANVTEKIQSLLTITKLITVFENFDSVEEAVGSF